MILSSSLLVLWASCASWAPLYNNRYLEVTLAVPLALLFSSVCSVCSVSSVSSLKFLLALVNLAPLSHCLLCAVELAAPSAFPCWPLLCPLVRRYTRLPPRLPCSFLLIRIGLALYLFLRVASAVARSLHMVCVVFATYGASGLCLWPKKQLGKHAASNAEICPSPRSVLSHISGGISHRMCTLLAANPLRNCAKNQLVSGSFW